MMTAPPETPLEPSTFSLTAFPNPFNSTVTISYSVGLETDATRLGIYDLTGSVVADLSPHTGVNTPRLTPGETADRGGSAAGKGKVVWNASDIPAGIYFVNLTQNNHSIQKKLILMK